MKSRDIELETSVDLTEVNADTKEAVFRVLEPDTNKTLRYETHKVLEKSNFETAYYYNHKSAKMLFFTFWKSFYYTKALMECLVGMPDRY